MRRAEVVTISVVLAAILGLVFAATVSPLAGVVSVVVVGALSATLLARGPLDRAGGRRRSAECRRGYAGAVRRIGKWSMERMPAV
jgi:hypothetical protein